MGVLRQPLFWNAREPQQESKPAPRRLLRPRAGHRHTPALSRVSVELQDGRGVVHVGQLWDISDAGAGLCFSKRQLVAGTGLVTSLRLRLRSSQSTLDLPVEVRWIDLDHGAWFVGVRFSEQQAGCPFLKELIAA